MHTFSIFPPQSVQGYATFRKEVIQGLCSRHKYLNPKYFYDAIGDKLFQQIMELPEYYPTGCESDILSSQAQDIIRAIRSRTTEFDLIELGAGDATKTSFLLRELLAQGQNFTYFPVDISASVIHSLDETLPARFPGLQYKGLQGEYMEMLRVAGDLSVKPKVILFMGANIGNFHIYEALEFCREIHEHLQPGDLFLVGFDLKKEPQIILDAYNDSQGVTKAFNLNLLHRINQELGADFQLDRWGHFPTYDPLSGSCKSYLVSKSDQKVQIGDVTISFAANEPIFMEISQKYTLEETKEMALASGFRPLGNFLDSKGWFADCLWGVE